MTIKDPCHLARVTATSWLLWGATWPWLSRAAALAEAPWSIATVLPTTQGRQGSMSPLNYMNKYYQTIFNTNSASDNC